MQEYDYEPGSFRDRNGRIFYIDEATYRALSDKAYADWQALAATRFWSRYTDSGQIIHTERVDKDDLNGALKHAGDWAAFLQHHTVPYISYPYEWSFSMLRDAALLHLELLSAALDEDMILKDSSAYNIQWLGARPVFIDIPSFEKLPPGEPWAGYRQFCQLFLYPLLLQAYKDVEFHPWLRGSIDGIDPVQINNLMSLRDRLRPGVFTNVYLQAKMQAGFGGSNKDMKSELKQAGFSKQMIRSNVVRIHKLVAGLQWKARESQWSAYTETHSYSDADLEKKADFVERAAAERNWARVWDVGCNTGKFSRIAARHADYVVAMDADQLCIDFLYDSLNREGVRNILPLRINLADASPALGWRGLERKSLTGRGKPDLVLCLALVHHVTIGANIPLLEYIQWLASLGAALVIEFVSKDDAMVKTLLRNKVDQYDDYYPDRFRQYLETVFTVKRHEVLGSGTRELYYAIPKAGNTGT
jgi:SAM-dependent methyltransferase